MLDIDMRFKQGILFIRLNGILNGDTCMKLEESISTLIEDNGIKYVLFNLNNLDYIDKYGINLILKNYINITNNNGNLIICGIEKLFTYTNSITNKNLDDSFSMYIILVLVVIAIVIISGIMKMYYLR